MVLGFLHARQRSKGRPSRIAALAVRAREHVVTVAALASVNVGCFRASAVAGFIVLGASFLVLDFAVTGK
jgi:hypothetical protein